MFGRGMGLGLGLNGRKGAGGGGSSGGGGGGSAPVLTHISRVVNSAASSTYAFSSADIGTAAPDRVVIVAVATSRSSALGARSISSLTLGGNAMTAVGAEQQFNTQATINLFYLEVAAGTAADIVVSLSGANSGCSIDVYTMTGQANAAPAHTAKAAGNDPIANIDIAGPACLVAVGAAIGTGNAITWSGATADSDAAAGSYIRSSAASAADLATETGRAVAPSSAASAEGVVVASWA